MDSEAERTTAAETAEDHQADTRAADAVKQPHTRAAGKTPDDEKTQSIHAWSLADDADTEVSPFVQRSWKIPAVVAAAAAVIAAAVGVSFWAVSQNHRASTPEAQHQAVPAPLPQGPDAKFLALYRQRGFKVAATDEQRLLGEAHDMLADLKGGVPKADVVRDSEMANPQTSPGDNQKLVDTIIDAYQPVPATPEERFVTTLKKQGWKFNFPDYRVAATGHAVCQDLDQGMTFDQVVDGGVRGTGLERSRSMRFVSTAISILCPQHEDAAP